MSVLIEGIQNVISTLSPVMLIVTLDWRLCEPENIFFLIVLFLFTPSCKWFLTKNAA